MADPKQISEFPDAGALNASNFILLQQGATGTALSKTTLGALLDTAHTTLTVSSTGSVGGNFTVGNSKLVVTASSGNLTSSGTGTFTGRLTSKGLGMNMGAYSVLGSFDYDTAPLGIRATLPRADSDPPEGSRDLIRWSFTGDKLAPVVNPSNGQTGSLNTFNLIHQLGTAGGAVADSWSGNRTLIRMSLTEANASADSLTGPKRIAAYPALNVQWITGKLTGNRGGTAPERLKAQGSSFQSYKMWVLADGATNLNNVRFNESGLFIQDGSSVLDVPHYSMNLIAVDGLAPVENWKAFTGNKKTGGLGIRGFFALGERGYGAVDELEGYVMGYRASHANPHPMAKWGIHFRDMTAGSDIMNWPNGRIVGGAHATAGTGALELGPARLTPTSTGLTLDVAAYTGKASGYVFTDGVDIVEGDPIVPARNYSIGDDAHGGTYLCYGLNPATNEFRRIAVINPPRAFGSAPSNPIEIRLRHNSAAQQDFLVTGTATTTSHPSKATHTNASDLIGRYLAYYTGACAGQRRVITGYDPATRIITTDAFTTSPTAEVNAVQNPSFALVLPTVEDTVTNGWRYTLNGGTGSVQRVNAQAHIAGDGVNEGALQQNLTLSNVGDGVIRVRAEGPYSVRIGTARGEADILDEFVTGESTGSDEDGDYQELRVTTDFTFETDTTDVWIELANLSATATKIISVRCADAISASDIVLRVRAGIEAGRLSVNHGTWTLRNDLVLQSSGGGTYVGGALSVDGGFVAAQESFSVDYETGFVAIGGGLQVGDDANFDGIVQLTTQAPASAAAAGAAGTITWDGGYIYICTATNTWKRAALATW